MVSVCWDTGDVWPYEMAATSDKPNSHLWIIRLIYRVVTRFALPFVCLVLFTVTKHMKCQNYIVDRIYECRMCVRVCLCVECPFIKGRAIMFEFFRWFFCCVVIMSWHLHGVIAVNCSVAVVASEEMFTADCRAELNVSMKRRERKRERNGA